MWAIEKLLKVGWGMKFFKFTGFQEKMGENGGKPGRLGNPKPLEKDIYPPKRVLRLFQDERREIFMAGKRRSFSLSLKGGSLGPIPGWGKILRGPPGKSQQGGGRT